MTQEHDPEPSGTAPGANPGPKTGTTTVQHPEVVTARRDGQIGEAAGEGMAAIRSATGIGPHLTIGSEGPGGVGGVCRRRRVGLRRSSAMAIASLTTRPAASEQPTSELIQIDQVLKLCQISRSQLYRVMGDRRAGFPKPVSWLGGRNRKWRRREVMQWIATTK
jgi:predicted DNA-binding transcriptional regulator AlpA